MCGRITNLVQGVRRNCTLPIGETIDPEKLDAHFDNIPHDQRGELSRRVLAALPKNENMIFKDEMRKALLKKVSLDQPVLELGTFLAVGHHAMTKGVTVHDVLKAIESSGSGVGIILRAV